jgi:repressor LexA
MTTLTTQQTNLLNFIRDYLERNTYAPTYEEMRVGLGWSTKSLVDYHLTALQAAGYIDRTFASPRTIVLTTTNEITQQEA